MEYRWRALWCVGAGSFLATLDFGAINLALPVLAREFRQPPDVVVWATLGPVLVVTGLTLSAGRLGDLFGRKRVYLSGWVLFAAGLVGVSLAPSLPELIALRVLQGVGLSLTIANSNALVVDAFPATQRGRALGIMSGVVGAGLLSGPVFGGLVLSALDWRAVFYLRVPLALAVIVLCALGVRETARARERGVDVAGAALLFAGLGCSVLALNRGQSWGWASPELALALVGAVSGLFLFGWVESRSRSPVLSLELFRRRAFVVPNASIALVFVGLSALNFLMPFYLLRIQGYSEAEAGLIVSVVPLMLLLLAPFSGRFADRPGGRHQATLGLALASAGLFSLATLGPATPVWSVALRLALTGLGLAVFSPPNSSQLLGSVPSERLGTASAALATARNIGHALGLAVASAVLAGATSLPDLGRDPERLLGGIRAGFGVAAMLSLLAVAVSPSRRGG